MNKLGSVRLVKKATIDEFGVIKNGWRGKCNVKKSNYD